ncbi:MAG: hypothetical protein NUK57_02570 [Gudongella sp.]|nr:hypothetical protein [Gudongella sp.]
MDLNEIPRGIVRDETGRLALAQVTGGFANETDLNAAIETMWEDAFYQGYFDARLVSQSYVDHMEAALSNDYSLEEVPIPAEVVFPPGKTFSSAEVKHDVNDIYGPTGAVGYDANWGGRLIVWMNTNMAYGWEDLSDYQVVYTYLIHWTDGTSTEYPVTFEDADLIM